VYRDKSREEQVLNIEDKNASKRKTFQEKQISASSSYLMPRERPQVVYGSTRKMKTGCGNLYVTINEDDKGIFEVFTAIGKAGGCAASQSEAIGRLISLSLRAGVDPDAIIRPFPAWKDGETILSCADAIARALKSYLAEKNSNPNKTNKSNKNIKQAKRVQGVSNNAQSSNCEPSSAILICPECGNSIVEHVEGCVLCPQCGFSKC
jgi:ribonucleoside-diphosphate reductase alpha chain